MGAFLWAETDDLVRLGYRGTSLARTPPLGRYNRTMPRALWWPKGRGVISYARGTPVDLLPRVDSPQENPPLVSVKIALFKLCNCVSLGTYRWRALAKGQVASL